MGISSILHYFCILLHGDLGPIYFVFFVPQFLEFKPFCHSHVPKLHYILLFQNSANYRYNCCYVIYHWQKQFRQPHSKKPPAQKNIEASSHRNIHAPINETAANVLDGSQITPPVQNLLEESNAGGNRVSVHNRMRVPVTYDDLLVENPGDNATWFFRANWLGEDPKDGHPSLIFEVNWFCHFFGVFFMDPDGCADTFLKKRGHFFSSP